jgi:membrane protease YdiL (CAAX protease family)
LKNAVTTLIQEKIIMIHDQSELLMHSSVIKKPLSSAISMDRVPLLSLLSLPIVWGVFQVYRLLFSKPLVEWILATYPQFFENLQTPYPFVASSLNLVIFGSLALIWPALGFGHFRKPDRYQSFVVLLLVGITCIYPLLNGFVGYTTTPFKQMGFVIWTITPIQEEIFFRGFLYTLLLRLFHQSSDSSWRDVLPVLLLGAAWFSLWHLTPHAINKYGWDVVGPQLGLTFMAGILFNGLRHWTGSIWLVIPVHAAGNFMVSIMN